MPQNVYIYDPDVRVPDDVQHVEIPEGITIIQNQAFRDHYALQSVVMPESITEIGAGAFDGCWHLQSVTIPAGVRKIGNGVFWQCSGLQSVTITDGITEIGDYTFCGCSGLQSITIPDSVTEIGYGTFRDCSALQSVTIPDSITEIKSETFYNCSGLQSVTIPDSVTKIGSDAFAYCSGLRSVVIPDSVTEIGAGAFSYCSGLQSVTIPDSVTEISKSAFFHCSNLQSVVLPDGITTIGNNAFTGCSALQSLIYKGVDIAPFININGYGVNAFDVIRELVGHQVPLSKNIVNWGIAMAHQGILSQWAQEYSTFGQMRLSPAVKSVDMETKERLRQCFADQKRTRHRIPKILDQLAITTGACGIPPERLASVFDVDYTEALLRDGIPVVPATACRCYYDRGICNMLIRKGKSSVMAEAITLYNRSGHQECYRHLMDFILSHQDTGIEDLQYAVVYANEIPMRAGTTLAQVRQHRAYTENLAEVAKIERKYGKAVPGFRLSDCPCSIDPISMTYDGMTARVLDLSDNRDVALAAGLGELTNCCQGLGKAGETAMMHGFLNPDAGFWVIEDGNGNIKAQAEIWEANPGTLVFDNMEFANTDSGSTSERVERFKGVIAVWAAESGYRNIVMGCGYNELGTETMEEAPIPELRLTPEEVFVLREENNAGVSFENTDEVRRYMQTGKYRPGDFVYTDADKRCVYIKKNGTVSDYLAQGFNGMLVGRQNEPVYGPGMRADEDMQTTR